MQYRVVFIIFGLAAQLEGYVLLQMRKQTNQSDVDVDAVIHKRVTRSTSEKADSPREYANSRKHNRDDSFAAEPDNKVLALGLDTGVVGESKNGIVQAISDAFADLVQTPQLRSHGKGKHSEDSVKKPIAFELKSESLLRGLENFLASPKVRKITHDLARKAAVIYRAIEKEL